MNFLRDAILKSAVFTPESPRKTIRLDAPSPFNLKAAIGMAAKRHKRLKRKPLEKLIKTGFIPLSGEVNRRAPGAAIANGFEPFVPLCGYLNDGI